MATKAADLEAEVIGGVCERVREQLPDDQVEPCQAFVRQYYHWVPPQDLQDRDHDDLYGAAMAQWSLAQERKPSEVKIRVYNPDRDTDGWSSEHTVVELVCDDMPFLVDSVMMALGHSGHLLDLVIHPVIAIVRDERGRLQEVLEPDGRDGSREPRDNAIPESIMHVEVARETDPEELRQLSDRLEQVLQDVQVAVADWKPMREKTQALIDTLEQESGSVPKDELDETRAFLTWLADDNFTFLGYREYEFVQNDSECALKALNHTGLGVLRGEAKTPYTRLTEKALELAREPHLLVLTKANSRATVHRPAHLDYIGVKRFDEDGRVLGERRFLGLYTTSAYRDSAQTIPVLRGKVKYVLERAGFAPDSHDHKALAEILETFPRDSLLQIDPEQLFETAMGILGLGERQRVRLFIRRDPLGRFMDCLVCIPRDRFNTENRERVAAILVEQLAGSYADWSVQLSESLLARVQYLVHCDETAPTDYDTEAIEQRLVQATRAWSDDLRAALVDEHGEEEGRSLYRRYEHAFPAAYRADFDAQSAVQDIARIARLLDSDEPIMNLYRPPEAKELTVRCELFSTGGVSLSDVLPTFEHMGAKVVDERPYEIAPDGHDPVWLYDFGLQCVADDVERVDDLFQKVFLGVWRGELEDDTLNGLVLGAALTGRQITVVRAIAKYLRQAGTSFSDTYIQRTVLAHPEIASRLVALFAARFDPDEHDERRAEELGNEIERQIDEVESLDQDRILRSFLSVLRAILRTNFFCDPDQHEQAGALKGYLSFKLDPDQISILPLPRPRFEIFVYSPRVEGVHLRGGKVARGGLRWSDRREDFRTEILGLMKAQMVKNALIVPVGSKGGFVVKQPPSEGGREALTEEAIACYRTFLSGLLDLTDNIVQGKVTAPERVVRYDDDDPYLVVAADKGTASFSDIANEVSQAYGFWLGDAFASGGSRGYDHKAMGITARGAWESVKRHFRELGLDVQSTDFTVVGIGDMSGDVFGNGMLLSRHIKLLAAFNHQHVFLDPDPDPEASFKERKRLFELDRSGWDDYDEGSISEGGGVFSRSAKSISLSEQAREALGIDAEQLSPNELISELLRAPVDLLWNGGIGTYVKASSEATGEAGDKTNDAVRIDADELRCRVVGEGGNLGLTQRARIEFALAGGRINTDAIDNVAGVNTSDHEVNIKILLSALVDDGELSEEQRNELLQEMTDAVAHEVLYGSYTQTQAVSLAMAQAAPMVDVHARLIRHLEQTAGLNRKIEFLPDEDELGERKSENRGLLAPELAVMMAYCKIHLYSVLLDSDLPEDSYLFKDLERYFAPPLAERYSRQMRDHRLRREIIATVVANQLVDRAGTTFSFRLGEETGAPASILARAYAVSREIFDMREFWEAVEALDNKVDAHVQLAMLIEGRRLVERATRWLVRANPHSIDISRTTRYFKPCAETVGDALPEVLDGADREAYDQRYEDLRESSVPAKLASRVAGMAAVLAVFDITEVAAATNRDVEPVMRTYFRVGARLELNWLRDRIIELPREDRWQALARAALRDDLYSLYRSVTQEVLEAGGPSREADAAIDAWIERNEAAVRRAGAMISDIKSSREYDMTTLPVALREVRNLIRGGVPLEGVAGSESVTMGG